MKQNLLIGSIILIFFVGYMLIRSNKINMDLMDNGRVHFKYSDKNILRSLSKEDLEIVKKVFDGKILYKDNPSCGFDENIAILFNDDLQKFYIACDGCPIIYYKNEGRYFKISDNENKELRNVLEKYGFQFPCV